VGSNAAPLKVKQFFGEKEIIAYRHVCFSVAVVSKSVPVLKYVLFTTKCT